MRIEDLTPDSAITLFVNIDGQQLTFETKILEVYPKKHLVLAEVIYHDEKIVTFRRKDITIDVLFTVGNEKPQLFQNVAVTLVRKNDNTLCYNLSTPNESKPCNRRQNFRCYVGIPTSFQCGLDRTTYIGVIRDVSVNGFAFVAEEPLPVEKGQLIHVILKDHFADTGENFVFHLYGIIVRTQELQKGSVLYGCRLNKYQPALEAYIMKKERQRLKRTNGGDL